ncbi:acyl-CoA dehydrogenase family protein [Streptomyces sp. NPDC001493]
MDAIDGVTAPPAVTDRTVLSRRYAALYEVLHAHAAEADRAGRLPRAVLDALRSSGILATAVPREFGGDGGGALLVNRIVEQVAGLDPSVAIILFQHFAVTSRIAEWASDEQRAHWLPRLADGRWLAASAWSETGASADKRNIATEAVAAPGGWVLNGAKSFTTGAGLAQVYLVLTQTSRPGSTDTTYGSDGQSFFLVEADTPGLVADTGMDLVGMRASATGSVELDGCFVPAGAALGPLGKAASIIAGVRETGATLGAVAVGIADAVHRLAEVHVRKRGADALAVRHLAELAGRVESARAAVESAGRRDNARPGLATLHSKVIASTVAEEVCLLTQRLLGSAGFLRDHPVNRLARDVRAVGLMGPTNELCLKLITQEGFPS